MDLSNLMLQKMEEINPIIYTDLFKLNKYQFLQNIKRIHEVNLHKFSI